MTTLAQQYDKKAVDLITEAARNAVENGKSLQHEMGVVYFQWCRLNPSTPLSARLSVASRLRKVGVPVLVDGSTMAG